MEAETITGATFETGKIFFCVKWKDSDVTDIVSSKDANLMIPQLVIQFYQERVDWGEEEEKEVEVKHVDLPQGLPQGRPQGRPQGPQDLPQDLPYINTATL